MPNYKKNLKKSQIKLNSFIITKQKVKKWRKVAYEFRTQKQQEQQQRQQKHDRWINVCAVQNEMIKGQMRWRLQTNTDGQIVRKTAIEEIHSVALDCLKLIG